MSSPVITDFWVAGCHEARGRRPSLTVRSGVAGVLPKSRSADRGRAVGIAKQDQMEVGKTDPRQDQKVEEHCQETRYETSCMLTHQEVEYWVQSFGTERLYFIFRMFD
jgi:hypothetical protein